MSKRKHLRSSERNFVFSRDGWICVKCGRKDALQINHIVSLLDGGTDEAENLSTLCEPCHLEWHGFELSTNLKPTEAYDMWLSFPSVFILIIALSQPDINHVSLDQFKNSLKCIHKEQLERYVELDRYQ